MDERSARLIYDGMQVTLFGIPLLVIRRNNRIQSEDSDSEPSGVSATLEVTPVNDAGPQLTQEPAITSGPIAVDPNPVPPVKPAVRRRVEKKATVAPVAEKKPTRRSKPKADVPSKELKKALKEVADMDKAKPVLSKDFALKHGLKLDEKKTKTTKKTTKSTKTVKKSAPKTKKSK